MMMKKTTSALAVAALLGTGAASAATFQVNDDTSLTIYGDVQLGYSDTEGTGTDFFDIGSGIGFSGEHDTGNGFSTFFNLDIDGFDWSETGSATTDVATDEASVGLKGDFGTVVIGTDRSTYDATDKFDYFYNAVVTAQGAANLPRLVQYRNSTGAVSYELEASFNSDSEEIPNGGSSSVAASAAYDAGAFALSAAYDAQNLTADGQPIYGIFASTEIASVAVDVGYQVDDSDTATENLDIVSASAKYNYGPGSVYGVIQNVSYESSPAGLDGTSATEVGLGVDYSVGSAMTVFAESVNYDETDDAGDVVTVGIYYGF